MVRSDFGDQFALDVIVCALSGYDEDGHPEIQTDSPGMGGQAGTHPARMLMPNNFHSRPLDPDKGPNGAVGLGASGLCVMMGDMRHVMPLEDPRDRAKIPKLRKGGSMMSGGAGEYRSFITIDGLDPDGVQTPGSLSMFAAYAKAGAKKSLAISFNVRTPGEEEISVIHGEGHKIVLSADGSVQLWNKDASCWIECGDDGNVLAGDTTIRGSCNIGGDAGLPVALAPMVFAMVMALAAKIESAAATVPALAGTSAIPVPFMKLIESFHTKTT